MYTIIKNNTNNKGKINYMTSDNYKNNYKTINIFTTIEFI